MTDDTKIQPAMTAEEWAKGYDHGILSIEGLHRADGRLWIYLTGHGGPLLDNDESELEVLGYADAGHEVDQRDRHAIAAACLHGQPFGFTWADVDTLNAIANTTLDRDPREPFANPVAAGRLRALAERLAALLPPREP